MAAGIEQGLHPAPIFRSVLKSDGKIDEIWIGWYNAVQKQFNSSRVITTGSQTVSPFVYVNTGAQPKQNVATVFFYITSILGNVNTVKLSRDGGNTFLALPVTAHYPLMGGDQLQLTFIGTLTYTVVPQ